ncbi:MULTISPECIES: hypothetical protein [unclassified Bradyrhizobium]|uniref:hypothetical protein n=1 Tax=unclassified Bradyrhizobium TaxID=2631580 RepID=UPI0007111474|nr:MULTISPECIES: hypothetical protein [unclassified Bradyrhizobium]KQT23094.1 hypothetical protein ASG57_25195 [Bradyrhizobium sp. Leaf396]
MSILKSLFGKKPITSTNIAAEIEKARAEHDAALTKRGAALAGLGLMDDAAHQKAEAEYELHRRAADRAAARLDDLEKAHAEALAAEAEAERIASEHRLRDRVEAARHAVEVEAAELLRAYDDHAAVIGNILSRLEAIHDETSAVNEIVRRRPDIDGVVGVDAVHRKHPDRQASVRREKRLCWVAHDGHVTEAQKDADGGFIRPPRTFDRALGYHPEPKLEEREIVVERTKFRPGRYENPLSAIHLPAGFANGHQHWPRK